MTDGRTIWWRGAAIYQIYPRSFADSNDDGIGDLPGITARLDHVASLGVDAIWLSPFFTSPMRDFGYDVADYRDVDPIFGTLADFDALVARAHALGLKVIIDQVYAHTSDKHAWFAASRQDRTNPHADWYVWHDAKPEGSPPSNWQSVFGGPAWTWDARRGQYYMHNFLAEQPQLNMHNPAVQDALIDVARFWLDRGVDGFRLDAINFAMHDAKLTDNPPVKPGVGKRTRPFDFQHHYFNQSHRAIPAFLERLRAVMDGYDGDRFTVAEVGGERASAEMKAYTKGDTRLNTAYGFDFLYAERFGAQTVLDTFAEWAGRKGEGWPSWAFSNHDAPRHVTRWGEGRDRDAVARLTMLLLVALRGNIFLYQGEELGLPQAHVPFDRLQDPEAIVNWPQTLGRDGARTPMPWTAEAPHAGFATVEPWLPVDPAHLPLSVAVQEADAGSMLHFTRKLLALRRMHLALLTGSVKPLKTDDPVLAFERREGEERLVCVFNLGDAPARYARKGEGAVIAAAGGADGSALLPPLSGYIARVD